MVSILAMTRAARPFSALLSVLLLSAAAGCTSQSNIGNPCDKAEQCGDGLICDFHDGKGTCQEPHGHGTDGETADTADTDDHSHETDDHSHETDDHSTDSTSSGTGPTEATTEHGETEHDHTGTTADTTTSTG
ncbi:hypothetical protein POL25_13445 [Nannocystis sp. bb15-2]|uniref:Lipoprotein n=2 Tax=Nannocystis bainbridge TaxID=2995303 RepID=A0ABT5DXL2_9BACT|nr:hypothetical protein [Nannocystis bainbridge]